MDQAYYKEAFKHAGKSVVTAGLVFLAFSMMGAPIWKAGVTSIVIMAAHRANIGRQYSEMLAFISIAVALVLWVGILPSRASLFETLAMLR